MAPQRFFCPELFSYVRLMYCYSKYVQELQDHGYVPVSIPVLSFHFDNLKELAQKMQEPECHRGRIVILIKQNILNVEYCSCLKIFIT